MRGGHPNDGVSVFGGQADLALVNPQVAHLPPRSQTPPLEVLGARHGIPPESFAQLASNETPLGPSERALEAAERALPQGHRYPDASARRLRAALAAHHGVSEAHVFVGNGSSEIIELLVRTFVGPGQTVVGGWPSFAAFRTAAEIAGREFLGAPLRRGRFDLAGMAALVDVRTKLVFLANPNNPTGTYVGVRELATFLKRLPPETIVVVDEAYADFVDAEDYPEAARDFLPGHPRLVVLRTFSKAHGLAGFRVGYGLMAPTLVHYLEVVQSVHSLNAIGIAAAEAALADDAHVQRGRRLVLRERARVSDGLVRMGLEPLPSQGNFLFVGGLPERTAARLEARGVLVRCMRGYGRPDAIRVSIGAPEANARFLSSLAGVLDEREAALP